MQILPTIPETSNVNFSYNYSKWLHEQNKTIILKHNDQQKPKEILLFYKDVMKHRK